MSLPIVSNIDPRLFDKPRRLLELGEFIGKSGIDRGNLSREDVQDRELNCDQAQQRIAQKLHSGRFRRSIIVGHETYGELNRFIFWAG